MKTSIPALLRRSLLGALVLTACSQFEIQHGGGYGEPPHGVDSAGHWDNKATGLSLTPATDVNPVGTQHVLIATVTDEAGVALPGRRVEWMLDGNTGVIVDVDKHGTYGWAGDFSDPTLSRGEQGAKIDNHYAVSHTNDKDEVLCMGTTDPKDDIVVERGQTYAVITSASEGTTNVIAYAPGIPSWADHKAFAHKHWMDVAWQLPGDAVNKVGVDHKLTTMVSRYSDKGALKGYTVTYKIVDGPAATLEPGGQQTATVVSDGSGLSSVTLKQAKPVAGRNTIEVSITRPGNKECCEDDKFIGSGRVTKTWVAPGIDITKTAPAKASAGETFAYGITVSNASAVEVKDVVVTDVLPDTIQYVSSAPAATVAGQKLTWNLGTLAAGGSSKITVNVKGTKTGKFTNCAEVAAEAGLADKACADTVITAPALALDKTAPAEVLICDPIPYRYVVRNNGDGAATNVVIRDTLPAGLTTADNKTAIEFPVGKLEAGQSREFTASVKAGKTGTYTNKAVATADGGLTDDASATTTVKEPVLTITKTGPGTGFATRPLTYDITVKSTGNAASRDTVLTDAVPAGATFKSATEGGALSGGSVRWNLGTLEPGASRTVSVTFQPTASGTIANTATVQGVCAKAVSATASTTVTGVAAVLLEVVDIDDPIEVGGNETYRIEVTNQGSAADTNVVITATLPAEQTYVSSTGPTTATVSGQTVTFGPLASLAAKSKATWTVTVKANAAGDVRFKTTLKTGQMKGVPVEETESTTQY